MSWIFRETFDPGLHARRAYAPVRPVTGSRARAGVVLASLLAARVYDDVLPPAGPRRRAPIAIMAGDMGRSASVTVVVAGKGDDPYGGVGVCIAPGAALGADAGRELAAQNGAVFGGASASRTV